MKTFTVLLQAEATIDVDAETESDANDAAIDIFHHNPHCVDTITTTVIGSAPVDE